MKWGKLGWALAALTAMALSAPSDAAVAVSSWTVGDRGPHPKTVTITDRDQGSLISIKLDGLPKGAKVYSARLCAARAKTVSPEDLTVDVEIYPGKSPAGKPLPLLGPWFNAFDATAPVRAAAEKGGELDLFVRAFPAWEKERTRLEVTYEGKPADAPPPVKDLKVLHRAGQTFITFREVSPLVTTEKITWGEVKQALDEAEDACTYRMYASGKRITADSVAEAELLAEVEPLSGCNVNGRNIEYLIGEAMVKSDEIGELSFNTGGLMYTWGPDSKRMDRYPVSRFVVDESAGPLPVGTGLYVHTPSAAGKRYYAVVSFRNGVANTADFSPANATDKPIEEAVGAGQPVCQGDGLWGPFFDYPGRRKVYVQWCAPPLAPLPSMYYNWSVLVPPDRDELKVVPDTPGGAVVVKPPTAKPPKPVELYFHAGNFSYAKPRRKFLLDSIQIAAHDFPASGWYGFNSAYGTLKSYRNGVVSNHTQQRIIAFLDWAKGKFPMDMERVILPGGDGAALLALNYPEVFAYVMISRFEAGVLDPRLAGWFGAIWGPKSPDIKDDQGRGDWGWAMLDQLILAHPKRDLPPFFCPTESWGLFVRAFGKGTGRFFSAMETAHQPIIANWSWGGGAPLAPDKYSGLFRGLDLARTAPAPAFANCTADANQDGNGQVNGWCTWWDVKETPESFQVSLGGRGAVDVTPRRCQKFKPAPGDKVRWEVTPLPAPRAASVPAPEAGEAIADANGLVTLTGVNLGPAGVTVKITRGAQ